MLKICGDYRSSYWTTLGAIFLCLTASTVRAADISDETLHLYQSKIEHDDKHRSEIELMDVVPLPFRDPESIEVISGSEGMPAYRFRKTADIKGPYRYYLPATFFRHFSLVTTFKPETQLGGFIFTVVNPSETIIQLGLHLGPVTEDGGQNLTLYYTDVNMHLSSQPLATFYLPELTNLWTKLALRVAHNNITVYVDCEELGTQIVKRIPKKLTFDPASTIYIGQAGPLLKGHFIGALQELKLFNRAGVAEVYCDENFQLLGSGDGRGDMSIENTDEEDGDSMPLPTSEGSGPDLDQIKGHSEPPPLISPPPPCGPNSKPGDRECKGVPGSKGDMGLVGPKGEPGSLTEDDLERFSGVKGEKGERGDIGMPGLPGIKGPKGECVYAGPESDIWGLDMGSGETGLKPPPGPKHGSCSCNATEFPELIGPSGIPGRDGKMGVAGLPGVPGAAGERGQGGPKGDIGDIGPQGPIGYVGPKGEAGADGVAGSVGPRGIPGPPGPPGASSPARTMFDMDSGISSGMFPQSEGMFGSGPYMGRPGPPGTQGTSGIPGPPGGRGERGLQGSKGDRGDKGGKGDKGPQGPNGERGFKGEQGTPGIDGIPGIPGEPGTRGENGIKGDQGLPGIGLPGPPGLPGHVTHIIGNIDDPNTDTEGSGSIIEGPPGLPGAKGDAGDSGLNGQDGIPGLDGRPGQRGNDGDSGQMGPIGPPGPKGEIGTEGPPGPPGSTTVITEDGEKIITGSKGERGDRGKRGKRGITGPPGPPGPGGIVGQSGEIGFPGFPIGTSFQGRPGIPGRTGQKGEPGSGTKGEKGAAGSPGPGAYTAADGIEVVYSNNVKGEKGDGGERGPTGAQGLPGMSGPAGFPGNPGRKGDSGSSGLTGPPGPPGPPGPIGPIAGPGFGDGLGGNFIPVPGPPGPPGSRGPQGDTIEGLPGPPGPPGLPGHSMTPNSWFDNTIAGNRGLHVVPGPPGPPGPPGTPGQPGTPGSGRSGEDVKRNQPTVVPGAVTFKNMESLLRMSDISPPGTLGFVLDEEALLVRVTGGWQYVQLGNMKQIPTAGPATTPATPPPIIPQAGSLKLESAAAKIHRKLRMAALNQPYSGDMHGIRGADYECYRQSRRANYRGTFRAFLSSRVQNLDSIVRYKDSKLPIVNVKGEVLFNSWKDLFTGASAPFPYPPRIYSFDGRNVLQDNNWPQKLVWHGSDRFGVRDMESYCDAWHSNALNKVGLASSLLRTKLLDQEKYSCNNHFIVLCIEATSQDDFRRRRRRHAHFEVDHLDAEEDKELKPEEYYRMLDEMDKHNVST